MMNDVKSYSELIKLPTFIERFRYLKLDGVVGQSTFGHDRWLNQVFYQSDEWKSLRNYVIRRDNACDLGIDGHEIDKYVIIHHMNPISKSDILDRSDICMNPEFLICVTDRTHKAIHYGDEGLLLTAPIERRPYDTCPWKRF